MAQATTPSIGMTTLPMPKEQVYTRLYRGGTLEMADGSIVHDLVDATVRHRFRLRWEYLSSTEKGTIQTAWDSLKNATATYTSIENATHTVTQPEVGAGLEVTPEVTAGGEILFHVTLELLEDS